MSSRPRGASTICMHPGIGRPDRFERLQKGVRGADLIFSVGPDQQEIPHL